MAAAALRAAVRQLFQPHLNPPTSASNVLFHSSIVSTPTKLATRGGNLETLNPLLPRFGTLPNGGFAKLGSAVVAAQGHQSLGIARLARVMLNYFGVGVTAWAAGRELTGGARTAYASAPKRHTDLADPLPTRASWQARSGSFFPSILTNTSSPKDIAPDASKGPLRELFEAKTTTPFERSGSPILSAVYDAQWARARSPPAVGLSGVWGSTEALAPSLLERSKHAGSGTKEAPKGLRVGAPPPNSPSAGLGLLMEEPVLPIMAPNIEWELVPSGLGWKGTSSPSPGGDEKAPAVEEAVPAVEEIATAVTGSSGSGELSDSGAWSLVLVREGARVAGESETGEESALQESETKKLGASQSGQEEGSRGLASFWVGDEQVAAHGQSENGVATESQGGSDGSVQGPGYSASSSVLERSLDQGKEPEDMQSSESLADMGSIGELQGVTAETEPLRSSSHVKRWRESAVQMPTHSPSPVAQVAPHLSRLEPQAIFPSEAASPTLPAKQSAAISLFRNNPTVPTESFAHTTAQTLENKTPEDRRAHQAGPFPVARELPPADTGSLHSKVSPPIPIQQGLAVDRAFAASAPAERARQPNRADVNARVDEVRLLGEALCHSQTRARRAEEAEAAKSSENNRLRELLLFEAMQRNTWQICLAIQTSDVSLLPIAVSENRQPTGPTEGDPMAHSYQGSSAGDEGPDGKSDIDREHMDFVDCVLSIAFGVSLLVWVGQWGFGWFCVRVGVMCGNTEW